MLWCRSFSALINIAFSIIVSPIFAPFAPLVANLINVPDDIMDASVTYMRIYCVGLLFLILYNFFAAVLRSLGDSVTPLVFLIISSLLNVATVCSVTIFIIGPALIKMFVGASETEVISHGTAYLRTFCPFPVFHAISLWMGVGVMGCAYAVPIGWFSAAVLAAGRYHSGKWKGKAVVTKTK